MFLWWPEASTFLHAETGKWDLSDFSLISYIVLLEWNSQHAGGLFFSVFNRIQSRSVDYCDPVTIVCSYFNNAPFSNFLMVHLHGGSQEPDFTLTLDDMCVCVHTCPWVRECDALKKTETPYVCGLRRRLTCLTEGLGGGLKFIKSRNGEDEKRLWFAHHRHEIMAWQQQVWWKKDIMSYIFPILLVIFQSFVNNSDVTPGRSLWSKTKTD